MMKLPRGHERRHEWAQGQAWSRVVQQGTGSALFFTFQQPFSPPTPLFSANCFWRLEPSGSGHDQAEHNCARQCSIDLSRVASTTIMELRRVTAPPARRMTYLTPQLRNLRIGEKDVVSRGGPICRYPPHCCGDIGYLTWRGD